MLCIQRDRKERASKFVLQLSGDLNLKIKQKNSTGPMWSFSKVIEILSFRQKTLQLYIIGYFFHCLVLYPWNVNSGVYAKYWLYELKLSRWLKFTHTPRSLKIILPNFVNIYKLLLNLWIIFIFLFFTCNKYHYFFNSNIYWQKITLNFVCIYFKI